MKWIFTILVAVCTFAAVAGTPAQNSTCVTNQPTASLQPADRDAVANALELNSKHLCASDACEFRVRKLGDGRTLVSLRAARYVEELGHCVTVYGGRTGVVFDPSGEISDLWPYCYLIAEELKHDPALETDLGYHWCNKPD